MTNEAEDINVPALIAASERILGASVGYPNRTKGTPRPQCHRLNAAWKELAKELGHEGHAVWVAAKDALPGLQIQGRDDHGTLAAYEIVRVSPLNSTQMLLTMTAMHETGPGPEVQRTYERDFLMLLRITE
jgi:hypothetical protein